MKKIIFTLATVATALMALVACEKEPATPLAEVSFKSVAPAMEGDVANFTIVVKDYTGTEAVEIPVEFSGDAVKDEDYKVSAEKFIVGGAAPLMTIQVTPLKFGTGRKVVLKLVPPTGFKPGQYLLSEAPLAPKTGYLSFELKKAKMTETVTVELGVYDGAGKALKVEKDVVVPISVDKKSTAIEGTHFKFKDKKEVVIKAGSLKGTVELEIIGEPEAGKDKIVLAFDPGMKFDLGQNATTEIKILGSFLGKLDGSWVANKLVTDKESMQNTWFDTVTGYEFFPAFNAEDALVIDLTEGIFKPSFKSAFKDYFIGDSKITLKGKYTLRLGMTEKAELELFELDNTNRFFSDKEKSEDKVSLVGVRILKEGDQELLDLYVIDYTSKSFFPELLEWGYDAKKPVAAMTGVFLNYTFKKATK